MEVIPWYIKLWQQKETSYLFSQLYFCILFGLSAENNAVYTKSSGQDIVEMFSITRITIDDIGWITWITCRDAFLDAQDPCNAQNPPTESECLHTVNRQMCLYLLAKWNMQLL